MDTEDTQDQGGDQSGQSEGDGSFYLPQNMLGGKTCKPGDKITLEVVGTDDEGDVEVKLVSDSGSSDYGNKGNFADDFRSAMNSGPSQT